MLTQEQGRTLLRKRSQRRTPVLIHGTSLEAAVQIFSEGRLPTSRRIDRSDPHPMFNGYLFFYPIKSKLVGYPLYSELRDTRLDVIYEHAALYAQQSQHEIILARELGYWPKMDMMLFDDFFRASEHYDNQDLLAHFRSPEEFIQTVKQKRTNLERLVRDRSGVIVGVNERIFDLNIENGCDDPGEEVMIHLPRGLAARYIQFVKPLGDYERRELRARIKHLPE